jgi:kumamolisin
LPGARAAGPVDPNEHVEITLRLRGRADVQQAAADAAKESPSSRKYMTPEELEEKFGATDADLMRVDSFAQENGLAVSSVDAGTRTVKLTGTLGDVARAFGVKLELFHHRLGTFRGRIGELWVPEDVKDVIEGVFGLDTRPVPRARRKLVPNAVANGQTGATLATRYKFPATATGSGQGVALIELGGGYHPAEIRAFARSANVGDGPKMYAVSVDGARNVPDGPNRNDGEVVLDMEVVATAAPGATIGVYFAPNTNRGFVDAILAAVHDRRHKPSVISISWGMPEDFWPDQYRKAMDDAFAAASLLGITVCVAAGDHGTNDVEQGDDPGKIHVDYPASSPYVLACGGTQITGDGEIVWNDGDNDWSTGGGISTKYAVPEWQKKVDVPHSLSAKKPGRGVPDVAGCATNYSVLVDGFSSTSGGTSAVAPLWAALVARLNQAKNKRAGFLNPTLYANPAALVDIKTGDNAAHGAPGYAARAGWDPCTGLGVPNGDAIAKLI